MQIQAAVVEKSGRDFHIQAVDLDDPREDEVLVRIVAVGLCHTDVAGQHGAFGFDIPAVLGHEGAGVVEAIGSAVTTVSPGDRVAISFRSCGHCRKCETSHPSYCETMITLNYIGARPDGSRAIHRDGRDVASNFFGQSSFATHAITYERNIVRLPDDIDFAIAAPLGCGVQTGVGSVVNAFACEAGSSLLVAGGGTVGLSAVMGGRIKDCGTIIVVEPHAARRELALELGATHVIDPSACSDLVSAVRNIIPLGVDYVLDTTGREDVLTALMGLLAPHGTLGCVGIPPAGTRVPGDLNMVIAFGQKVMGIIEGDSDPQVFIPQLIDHYRAGRLPIDRLIAHYPFSEINQAIADQHAGKCVKVILNLP